MKLFANTDEDLSSDIHGPNKDNVLAPYFPPETMAECEKHFKQVIGRLEAEEISLLLTELEKGSVNGCYLETNLLGTLARLLKTNRHSLRERLEYYSEKSLDPIGYWFRQIADNDNGVIVRPRRCLFTELTIRWCKDILSKKPRTI
ncbi:MAG: hypothetical protein HYT43_02725 [Candidatus Taylorbacteria bacterium]|nr:hypothetical protein [Candidatus Taylorbacteria bacterium]